MDIKVEIKEESGCSHFYLQNEGELFPQDFVKNDQIETATSVSDFDIDVKIKIEEGLPVSNFDLQSERNVSPKDHISNVNSENDCDKDMKTEIEGAALVQDFCLQNQRECFSEDLVTEHNKCSKDNEIHTKIEIKKEPLWLEKSLTETAHVNNNIKRPRRYERKTHRKNWTPEQLEKALKAIQQGYKVRQAGRQFGIPESTLRGQMKMGAEERANSSLGRTPVFSKQQEKELATYLIKLVNLFYGLTPIQLRKLAYSYASVNHVKHNFNNETKLAGKDWLFLFLKRNPEVSLCQPGGTSISRITSFNEEEVGRFFTNLETVFSKYEFLPQRVYNQDETDISTVQNKLRKLGILTSAERGKNITVACSMSAAGSYVPPMFIFPRKRMSPTLEVNGPTGAVYRCSGNGWMNEGLFLVWLTHFKCHVNPTEHDPVLLICDNHSTHISLGMYNFCRKNHIIVVSLPPHTSHRLQPLELTFFGPLKNALAREYHDFMTNRGHQRIIISDIAGLFNKAYVKVATMEKAVSGFKFAGIVPLNPDRFTVNDFAPAEDIINFTVEAKPEIEPVASTSGIASSLAPSFKKLETITLTSGSLEPMPSTSSAAESISFGEAKSPNTSIVSVANIAPVPEKNVTQVMKKAQRRKQHSQILTSIPLKRNLEKRKKRSRLH